MRATLWWLVQNSVAVAVLVAVVWAASRLLRNRPALQHALWLVVLVKFVTPPIVSWPWSASDLGDRIAQLVTPTRNDIAPSPTGESRSDGKPPIDDTSRLPAVPVASDRTVKTVEAIRSAEPTIAPPASPERGAATRLAIWLAVGMWLAGCVIALVVQLRRIARHSAVVRRGRPAPQLLVDEIAGVAGKFGLPPVSALVVRQVATPFLWCLGRLRLIWPESLSSEAELRRCRGIIAHELAHVKRCDHWVTWLELLAGVLWWWNPLFWYVRRQLRDTADIACDAQALNLSGADRRAYAEAFLTLSDLGFQRQTPAPALGVSTGARRTIERRLSMILNERVKTRVSVAGLLFAALFALVALPVWSLGQDGLSSTAPDTESKEGIGLLRGTWSAVSIESVSGNSRESLRTTKLEPKGLTMTFDGKTIIRRATRDDGKVEAHTFRIALEQDQQPARLTVYAKTHALRYIYEVKDDTLRLCCFSLGEQDGREVVAWPATFSTEDDKEKFPRLEVWKRVRGKTPAVQEPAEPAARHEQESRNDGASINTVARVPDAEYTRPSTDQQTAAATIPADAWGEPVKGLRAALRLPSPAVDEKGFLRYDVVVENVSDADIRFAAIVEPDQLACCTIGLTDVDGNPVPRHSGMMVRYYTPPTVIRFWLKPKERAVISPWGSRLIRLDEAGQPVTPSQQYSQVHYFRVKPGRYSVLGTLELGPKMESRDPSSGSRIVLSPAKGEWSGTLTTGVAAAVLFAPPRKRPDR